MAHNPPTQWFPLTFKTNQNESNTIQEGLDNPKSSVSNKVEVNIFHPLPPLPKLSLSTANKSFVVLLEIVYLGEHNGLEQGISCLMDVEISWIAC